MPTTTLEKILSPFTNEFQVILEAADSARRDRLGLSRKIASSNHGQYERVMWLDHIDKNLDGNVNVSLTEQLKRHNFLLVKTELETLMFSPFFGHCLAKDRYSIHNKGVEATSRPWEQPELFEVEDNYQSDSSLLLPYLIRHPVRDENGIRFELHFVLGEPPQAGKREATIKVSDRYIFAGRDKQPVVEAYEVPFDPAGVY